MRRNPAPGEAMASDRADDLRSVTGRLGYLADSEGAVRYRIYPASSGKEEVSPPKIHFEVPVQDCRPIAGRLDLDREGFTFKSRRSSVKDFFDQELVRVHYYAEVEALVTEVTGAMAALVFDHNVRSAAGARQGVRAPVDAVHGDYTEDSGAKRVRELLAASGQSHLSRNRAALINVWRPIKGPVQDLPLAICDARSIAQSDLVSTDIEHYSEEDLIRPSHSGRIYSVRYNPRHRWYYVSDMQPEEVLLFKCYDSLPDGVARCAPHTGFANPQCPARFIPRESIEARTLVIYPTP